MTRFLLLPCLLAAAAHAEGNIFATQTRAGKAGKQVKASKRAKVGKSTRSPFSPTSPPTKSGPSPFPSSSPVPPTRFEGICPAAPANLTWLKPIDFEIDPHGQHLDDPTLRVFAKAGSIFAVVYFENEDITAAYLEKILVWMDEARCVAFGLGLRDPFVVEYGHLVPIYLHDGRGSGSLNKFGLEGAGIGTEHRGIWEERGIEVSDAGIPFMALYLSYSSKGVIFHEINHIMVRNPGGGIRYEGASMWYIEAFAEWFSALVPPSEYGYDSPFHNSQVIADYPHHAMWHSAAYSGDDSTTWEVYVFPYGMVAFLFYLTEVGGLPHSDIALPFIQSAAASDRDTTPQEWLIGIVGRERLRTLFADFAAANTAGFGYVPAPWREGMQAHADMYRETPAEPTVAELGADGTGGAWRRPDGAQRPAGWAYNVIRTTLQNQGGEATYRFRLEGDEEGSAGSRAHFEARLVIKKQNGESMPDPTNIFDLCGETCLTVDFVAAADAAEVNVVVVSTPGTDFGVKNPFQQYDYKYKLELLGIAFPPSSRPTPCLPAPPPTGGEGQTCEAVVYEHCDYSGWSVALGVGKYNEQEFEALGGKNNDISSMIVRGPPTCKVTLFSGNQFSEPTGTFGPGEYECESGGIEPHDVTSSVIVEQVCEAVVFEHCDYSGWSVALGVGEYNEQEFEALGGKNNDVSSMIVRGPPACKVTLFSGNQFSEPTGTFGPGEYECGSGGIEPHDVTSSIIVEQVCEAVVFEHCDYSGWSVALGVGEYNEQEFEALGGKKNDVSSMIVRGPPACKVTLFSGNQFSEPTGTFGPGEYECGTGGIEPHDVTSSVIVENLSCN